MTSPDPISAIPGVAWPAVAADGTANLLALQWQLQQSERWPRGTLEAHQFRQLDLLLRHCVANVPFWRERLARAGLPGPEPLDWDSWHRLPVLSRAAVRDAGSALHATSIPAAHGKLGQAATTGSTGRPLQCLKTELSLFFWRGSVLRELLWHGWDPAGKLAMIREDSRGIAPAPKGRSLTDWGVPISQVFATGPAALLDIRTPIPHQAAWLMREDPDYLVTWPSNLQPLARYCRAAGLQPARLRVVRTLGEVVSAELRALCRDAWGAELVDGYSAEEVGYIAMQCPTGTQLHVQSENLLLELLDEDNDPCRPGETGQVVVTPLHNFAMPLLRYAIGDAAVAGFPCACGRTLPTLSRVLGRSRDRLMLPGGERRFLENPSEPFAPIAAIRRYQVAQVALDRLEVRLEATRRLTPAEESLLTEALHRSAAHPFAVQFNYDAWPDAAAPWKFRDVVCEIDGDSA